MPTIGKSFTFEAAHRLQNHDGKCRNLHGHSYRVEVSVEGEELQGEGPSEGMLFDFGVLNEWWKATERFLDHLLILQDGDPLIKVLGGVHGVLIHVTEWPPTAENLAEFIRNELWQWLRDHVGLSTIVRVRVYETAKSWAEAG